MDQHVTKYYILRIAHYFYGHSIYPVCLRWTFVPKKYGCGNPITSFWQPPCTVRAEHKNGDRKNILRFIILPYNSTAFFLMQQYKYIPFRWRYYGSK